MNIEQLKSRGIGKVWIPTEKEFLEIGEGKRIINPKETEKVGHIDTSLHGSKEQTTPIFLLPKESQVSMFWKEQPFFYDRAKIFWLWDKENFKYVISDEIDFLNSIQKEFKTETIKTKDRTELIEAFKQVGRKNKPKELPKHYVQFKNEVYDGKTGQKVFDATPEYFVTNPIPYKVGDSEKTPTIDKMIIEWVGEEYSAALLQVIAYNTTRDKFMQRIIALCGGGSNGKGTFAKLNIKFLGQENIVASELRALSEDRFEPAVLYNKLLCIMGEVSFDDLKNTNMLKKLGGEDKISFQFKGKTPFTADNSATCMCSTNSMPVTPDKSLGFYRKWYIFDFPTQFKEIKESPIEKIPKEEFENLAKKCLRILKELYENPKFIKEGDFEERIKRYEERSNPVLKFVEEFCEEKAAEFTILREFTNSCNEYLKSKHLRVLSATQIGKILRNEGFLVGNRKINDISAVVILNLTIKTIKTIKNLIQSPYRETNTKLDSNNSSDSNLNLEQDQLKQKQAELLGISVNELEEALK